jgi:hypothetical protein
LRVRHSVVISTRSLTTPHSIRFCERPIFGLQDLLEKSEQPFSGYVRLAARGKLTVIRDIGI